MTSTTVQSADVITETRSRTGDNNASYYLANDTAMTSMVNACFRELPRYARREIEDTSIVGDGTTTVYALPVGIYKEQIIKKAIRSSSDVRTDREFMSVPIIASKIYLPYSISPTQNIVLWYWQPYVIGTDAIPDHHLEMAYQLMQVKWVEYAMLQRADFEQWAATVRSDVRIPELRMLRSDLVSNLEKQANALGNQLTVTNLWG